MSAVELQTDILYRQSKQENVGKSPRIEWSTVEKKRAAFTTKGLHVVEPRIPPYPEQHLFFTSESPWRVVINDSLYHFRESRQGRNQQNKLVDVEELVNKLNAQQQLPAIYKSGELGHAYTELFWKANFKTLADLFHAPDIQTPYYLSEIYLGGDIGVIDSLFIYPDLTMYVIDHYHENPNNKQNKNVQWRKNHQLRRHKNGLASFIEKVYGNEAQPTIVTLLGQYKFGEKENEIQLRLTTDSMNEFLPHIYGNPSRFSSPQLLISPNG